MPESVHAVKQRVNSRANLSAAPSPSDPDTTKGHSGSEPAAENSGLPAHSGGRAAHEPAQATTGPWLAASPDATASGIRKGRRPGGRWPMPSGRPQSLGSLAISPSSSRGLKLDTTVGLPGRPAARANRDCGKDVLGAGSCRSCPVTTYCPPCCSAESVSSAKTPHAELHLRRSDRQVWSKQPEIQTSRHAHMLGKLRAPCRCSGESESD